MINMVPTAVFEHDKETLVYSFLSMLVGKLPSRRYNIKSHSEKI